MICACGANPADLMVNANICRCVPPSVRELFQNQRVPNLVLFNTEWVHYFGHEYQNPVEVPEWLVIRARELSPAVVYRRSRTERAAREWARLRESYSLLRGPSFFRAELAEWTRGGLELWRPTIPAELAAAAAVALATVTPTVTVAPAVTRSRDRRNPSQSVRAPVIDLTDPEPEDNKARAREAREARNRPQPQQPDSTDTSWVGAAAAVCATTTAEATEARTASEVRSFSREIQRQRRGIVAQLRQIEEEEKELNRRKATKKTREEIAEAKKEGEELERT